MAIELKWDLKITERVLRSRFPTGIGGGETRFRKVSSPRGVLDRSESSWIASRPRGNAANIS